MIDDQTKIERVLKWLTESHLEMHGGYPYDYFIDRQIVWIAALDGGKDRARTSLWSYRITDLVCWYDNALEYIKTYNAEAREYFPGEQLLSEEWIDEDTVPEAWQEAFEWEAVAIEQYTRS